MNCSVFIQEVRFWKCDPARHNKQKFCNKKTTTFLTKDPNTSEGKIILVAVWNRVERTAGIQFYIVE